MDESGRELRHRSTPRPQTWYNHVDVESVEKGAVEKGKAQGHTGLSVSVVTPTDVEVCLGLDVGTTGCKVVAMDAAGRVHAEASATYGLYTDATGAAEQDAEQIWRAVCDALSEVLSKNERKGTQRPVGLALGGAMHSLLALGGRGNPLGRASTWADARAAAALPELRAVCSPAALYRETGCPLQAPYHPARLRWLRGAQPETFAGAAHFASLKDWLGYRLTGTLCTDFGYASTTGLLELRRLRWSEVALELAGVTPARLPELAAPTDRLGALQREAARACGLPEGLPVVLGSSDGGLANLGAGVRREGETIVTVGTSGAVRQISCSPHLDPQRRTWCYRLSEERFFAGGAINNGGLTLEWLRRTLYSELPKAAGFARLLAEAAEAEAQGLLLLPYLTGERSPHWDARVRGAIFGLSEPHGRADLARAALEGVAFCLLDVFELLRPDERPVKLTGGLSRSPFWGQLVADTLGTPIQLDSVTDASALGAAALGWVALQDRTLDDAPLPQPTGDLTAARSHEGRFTPDAAAHERYRAKRLHFRRLYSAVAAYSET